MPFYFKIDEYRCFHHTPWLPIERITLLTGENSSGKTSFLAGLRIFLEMLSRGDAPSFNKEPFYLGAFDQIAHFRGGSYGRAGNFGFSVKNDFSLDAKTRQSASIEKSRSLTGELSVKFRNYRGSPKLYFLDFSFDDYRITLEYSYSGEEITMCLYSPQGDYKVSEIDADEFIDSDSLFRQMRLFYFYLREAEMLGALDHEDDSPKAYGLLRIFSSAFHRYLSSFPNSVFAGAPVRTRPQRTYDPTEVTPSPEGTHVPLELARVYTSNKNEWNRLIESINEFGKNAGLFQEISIKRLGGTQGDPFQIYVKALGPKRNLIDVGYGVSQSLPIIYDLAQGRRDHFYLLQQPEVHLHPKAQAGLGEFLVNATKATRSSVIVETHSDFLIDRVRRSIRNGEFRSRDVSLLYFEKGKLNTNAHSIKIDKGGSIENPPSGYRDFFKREMLDNLGLSRGN